MEDIGFQTRVSTLSKELNGEISLRPSLQHFVSEDVHFTAYILARSGLDSVDDIKLSLPLNRKFLLQDLRDGDLPHRDLIFLLKVFETFQPTHKNRNTKHPEFEEVCIPLKLGRSSIPLASLPGLLLPDLRMVNEISEMIAKGQACSPAYTPYVYSPLNKEPWIPTLYEHKKAHGGWTSRMKSLTSEQSISFQSWKLYLLRYIFPAEVCGAWLLYGGIIAQINNLGITLSLAATGNVGVALKYFDFLHTQLESYARSRAVNIDYFRLFLEEQVGIKRRFSKVAYTSEGSSAHTSTPRNSFRSNSD